MEAKFILQPVHQVWPGLRSQIYSSVAPATNADYLLAMTTLKLIVMAMTTTKYKRVCAYAAGLVNDKVRDMISGRE